ncbi:MAG: type II toxin-antitoxin system HicB family antitoxin [Planctomycetes bacterium]|nr:type II toxin-antitoxin system HicB family antitoxin [Planctomycetota bacterium]
MTRRYTIVIEKADDGSYSVFVPDLPGCISCGDTPEEARAMIQEAIAGHIQLLKDSGQPIPEPRSTAEVVATK